MFLFGDGASIARPIRLAHRLDEPVRAIPWRGCSPAEPASVSPGIGQYSMALLSCRSPALPRGFEFLIAFVEDALFPPFEFVLGGHVADGAVQAPGVVMLDVSGHQTPCVVQGQGRSGPDALLFE